MAVNTSAYHNLRSELDKSITLVAVSKTKPDSDILELYEEGQRDFGENYVQELVDKAARLPKDIRWHFIGHLQTNKVKQILPFVHLIHGVDSEKLLKEIEKQSQKIARKTNVLLQVHISDEATKFGFSYDELDALKQECKNAAAYPGLNIVGLMGMASFTDNREQVEAEFKKLAEAFAAWQQAPGSEFSTLSMGMSADYAMAIKHGSNMIRVGTLLFGERNKAI